MKNIEAGRRLVYITGEPATGKTTLARRVLNRKLGANIERRKTETFGVLRYATVGEIAVLGRYDADRERFGGTDALSMAVMPDAIRFLRELPAGLSTVFAEGDRLASRKFFVAAVRAGYDLRPYLLETERDELDARRRARGVDNQSATFLKGRRTKYRNLAEKMGADLRRRDCNTGNELEALATEIAGVLRGDDV